MSAATALPAPQPPHFPRGRRRHPWPRICRLLTRLLTAWLVGSGTWVTLAVAQPAPPAALTLPSGGQVVVGAGAIQRNGAQMVVQQSTPRLGIDWQSFSIGSSALVEFRQPDANAVALNRVIGNEASQIYGRLTANGQVFLTNPNGVLFSRHAKVDVGGLVATTLDLTQDDFAAGRYRFSGASNAAVVNEGTIGASAGGYLVLLGQQVENAGEINVPAGQVVLASGRAATVSISGSGLLSAVVDPATSAGSVLSSGRIEAERGSVRLSAHSAEALAGSLVNNTGIVKATSIVERGGEIWITGDHVANSGRLEASAPAGGDGGRIMLLADMARGRADVGGTLDASSAVGRGGFVETSAARVAVADGARVTTLAPAGRVGTWLIDPNDYTVAASGGHITGATLSANLAGGNVTISTVSQGTPGGNGDIFVNDTVAWNANKLTLSAERHIAINAAMTGSGTASLALEVGQATVAAGNTARYSVGAPVGLPSGNSLTTKLGSDGAVASYAVITTLADLQAIDDRSGGNAAITARLAAHYALGADIDASSTATANGGAGFDPIGLQSTASAGALNSFSGRFEGLGHTISGLTVNRPADTASGLFASTSNAIVRNLALTSASITGGTYTGTVVGIGIGSGASTLENVRSTSAAVDSNTSNARVGVLAGQMEGPIDGSSASGTASVSGSSWVGGLVGLTSGTITGSTAAVDVTSTHARSFTGGLAGASSRAITASSASGAVSGGARVGGLVGDFSGSEAIVNASASGTVSSTAASADVGGLVGYASGTGSISSSLATGNVSAASNANSVGGLVGALRLTGGIVNSSAGAPGSTVSGGTYTGGVVGWYNQAAALVTDTTNTIAFHGASVSGGSWVGGLIGQSVGTAALTGLRSSADVTATGSAGGMAGYTGGTVTGVAATGNVTSTGTGTTYVGGLVGETNGAGGVTDASASGNVTSASLSGSVGGLIGYGNAGGVLRGAAGGTVSGGRHTGGLIGYFDAGAASIADSSAGGNVSGLGDAGGLVGYATGTGSLSGSSATGAVSSSAITTYSVGGVAGYFGLSGGVTSTTSAGNTTGGAYTGGAIGYYNSTAALSGVTTPASVTTVSGTTWVGGVIGYVNQATTLSALSSSANVTATGATGAGAAGGVVGRSYGAVSGSSASGNVSGPYAVGGLIGWAEGTGALTDSSASGNVSSPTAFGWIGGLVGRYGLSGSIGGTISATGTISGGSSAGGLVGFYNSSAPVAGLTRGAASVTGQDWVGGLFGYSEASSITGASSAADVTSTGTGYAAGGLIGRTTGPVSNSSASGSITAAGDAGGLVGRAEGSGAFTDVSATGNVASSLNSAAVGGLVGRASSGAITRGTASGTVSGGDQTGGLVGLFSANASITSSEATGNVSGNSVVGGLIGYASGNGGIADGTARGTVTGSASNGSVGGLVGEYRMSATISRGNAHGNVSGGSRTGGLTGYQYSSGGIANSNAYGSVTGTTYVGGLVGDFVYAGNITDSTAAGAVTGTSYAGGLVGSFYSAGALTTSTATGTVTGEAAGGLLGLWQYSSGITDSRATGHVIGHSYSGGLVGYAHNNSGGIDNSSAGGDVVGVGHVGGLIGQAGYTGISRGTATGTVRAVSDSTTYAGGLVGYAYGSGTSTSITDSSASGAVTVDAPYAYVGGLIGLASTVAIGNGRASGSVTLQDSRNFGSSSNFAGGLVGYYNASNTTGISAGSRATGAVTGGYYAGGLAGYYDGNAATAGISDSSASGNVNAVYFGGGLVGQMRNVGIRNSQASGDVSVSSSGGYAGGLLGYGTAGYDGASIDDSAATGKVTGGGGGYAGGLIGFWQNQLYNSGSAGVLNSRASGDVANAAYAGGLVGHYSAYYYGFASVDLGIRNAQATGNVSASQFVGGLVGQFDGYGGIRDSSATGAVTGTSGTSTHHMGGLAGQFINRNSTAGAGVITRSYATGNVALAPGVTMNSNTTVNAGGLVGQLDGTSAAAVTLTDSYASGNVTLTSTNGRLNAGGLVGQANASIDKVYSTGAVSVSGGNTRTAGGLVAARSGTDVAATDSYWATDSSGQAASVIGSGRTFAELQTAATFTGWDIANAAGSSAVWRIYEGFTTPLLRGFLTPLALSLVDVSKDYDGTASLGGATVSSSGGPVQFPDRIRVGGSGTSADAGTHALSASNLYSVQDGYDLNLTGTAQLTINRKQLTLSGLVANKVYDATTAATVAGTGQPGGLAAGEDLLFQPAGNFALAFADKNAGTAKTVNISGSYTWADGATGKVANYTLPTGTTTTADITKATLTAGTFTATDRAYDGTTTVAVTATPAALGGVLGSDIVSVDLTSVTSGTIANKNVGSGKAVAVVGASITGPDAGNYTLAGIDSATVNITPRTVTVNGITASNRSYNQGTGVSINTQGASLSGILAGDHVLSSLGSVSGTVADKDVGDGKPVTVSGLALRGVDAANYTPQQGSISVNITPRPVTIYATPTTGTNRVYDGTADATVALYNDFSYNTGNLWYGDSVTLSNTGIAYDNKNVAYTSGGAVTAKTITVAGLAISGADAGNYALQNTTATTTGTITPKPLPVTGVTAASRAYDGTRDVQVSVAGATVDTSVVVAGDDVSVVIPSSGTVTGQMANKSVGNGKAVTVPGLTITGNDAGNYTVSGAGNGVTVNITRKDLRVNYTASDKVYDGGTTASTNATSTDIVGGDDITFYSNYYGQGWYYGYNPWASFSDKNVGTGKTVSSRTESIFGNDAGNYNLIEPSGAIATASIGVKPVTLAFSGVSKVYDGTTAATVALNRGASGVYGGDSVSTTQSAVYVGAGAKNVGTGKAIDVSDIMLTGTDAANYNVANTTATTTGAVTPKPVTLSGISAVDRAYDGTTTVQVNASTVTSAGFVANDVVSIAQPPGGLTSGTIANKDVGTAKPVTVTGLSLAGTDAINYSIDLAGSGITVNIDPKALTPTYTGIDRVYNGGVTVGVAPTTAGIEAGDTVTFSQQAVFTGGGARNVGTGKPVSVTSITLGGASAANYALTATTAATTADVTPKPVTADYTGVSRVYSGLADTSISVIGSSLQLLAGDLVGFTQTATLTGDGSAGTNRPVGVSNIALTGQDAGNYSLVNTTATTTVAITPRPLGVTGITATNRVYDGTTTVAVNVAGATVDTSAKVPGDDVNVMLPPSGISTGTMADRHVGNAKPVSITGLTISGAQAANYSLIGASGLNVDVTPAPLLASYTAADKVYDGNASASVTGTSSDIFAADTGGVTINATGTFTGTGAKNVGTGKPVAVRDGFLGGAFRDNYTLLNPTGQAAGDITPKTITPSYVGGSRVYDGGTAAPVTAQRSGIVAGDDIGFTQVAVFTGSGAKNVGSGKPIDVSAIALTGGDAANYLLSRTTDSAWGEVTPKPITVSGLGSVSATNRQYDGTRLVEVVIPSGTPLTPNSADIVPGDDVGFSVPSAGTTTGTMADKRVGTGKAVAISGLALSGADGGNYTIAGTAGVTVDISRRAVTANYVGVSKVYDGTAGVSVSGSASDFIAGDAVGIAGGGVFTGTGAKNVGSAKPIQVTSADLTGSDAVNYLLTNPTGAASGDVTPRPVTPSYAGLSRVYDGTTAAPVAASTGDLVQGDDVRLTQTAEFTGPAAKDAGTGKPVAVSGITLTGGDAGNYALTATSASTTGIVTRRPVTLLNFTAATAVDRVYDGTTGVAVNVASTGTITPTPGDLIPGDDVQVQVPSAGTTTGTMMDKHAGTAKPVAVTGLGLAGTDAHNYMLSAAGGVTVNIAQRPLTATYNGVAKIYDGTTAASVTGVSTGLIAGDLVAIDGSGVYTDGKNAGTAKPIEVRSAMLSGADSANYLLGNPTGSAVGDVTQRLVTPAYLGGTRIYDGTVVAPVAGSLTGLVAGDAVTFSATAVFTGTGAKNVGSDKPVSVTGIAVAGTDAGNYVLATTSAATTAEVTPRPLGITGLTGITATDRVYDGTRSVAITIAGSGQAGLDPADLIAGDDVTIGSITPGTTTGTMVDKHVGTNKAVAVDGLTLGGVDAPNYVITGTAGVSVTITPRPITARYGTASKIYDGTDTISVVGGSADVIAADLLTITASGVFSDGKAAGNGKAIVIGGGALGGADAGNYLLAGGNTATTGNITPRPLTFDYLGGTRIYDGGVTAPVTGTLGGVIAGDSVDLVQAATFVGAGAKNVGANKPVSVSAIALTGGDAGNYSLGATTASTTATVLPKPLTISGLASIVAADRVYDGTRNVDLTIGSIGSVTGDLVAGDDVVITAPGGGAGAGTMLDKHVGSAKPVVVSGLMLSGADAGNYVVGPAQGVTVNITPRTAQLTGIAPVDRIYDGTVAVAIETSAGTLGGTIAGDDVRVQTSGVTGTIADKRVGTGKPVTLSGLALAGSDAGNYTVVTGALGVSIAQRLLTIGATVPDRLYDGTPLATVHFADDRVAGDQLSATAASAAFADKNAGNAKDVSVSGLALSGADAANYRLAAGTLALTGNILRAPLAVTALDQTKIYGDTFSFTGAEFVSSGLVAGESIGQVTLTSPGAAAAAGVTAIPYAITPSAPRSGTFDLANYDLRLVDGALQVQPRPLAVIADSVVSYPNDRRSLRASTSVGGLVNGDTLSGVQLTVPPESASAPGGSVYPITPSGGSLATGNAANYAISYASGLLVVVPQPPQIGQGSAGSSGDLGFAIVVSPEEVAATQLELARTTGALGQTTAEAGRGEIASRRLGSLRQLSPDEAQSIASRIAAEMAAGRSSVDLPTLQRMPLITLDAPLRRLIFGSDAATPAR